MGDGVGFDRGVVEELLRKCFGGDAALVTVRQIRPWSVARCHLTGVGTPTTVIVKWLRANPERFRVEPRQIANEVAALKWVGEVAPGIAPSLISHDLDRNLLVTEDLAPRRTLHSVLATGTATRGGVAGLRTFASTMARLHAATATSADCPCDNAEPAVFARDAASRLVDRLHRLAPVAAGVWTEVDAALTELENPGGLGAFSNGDSGANNCLVDADGGDGRLIDFEHACRRHVLLDAAALHVPGSMWMTVADPVPLKRRSHVPRGGRGRAPGRARR